MLCLQTAKPPNPTGQLPNLPILKRYLNVRALLSQGNRVSGAEKCSHFSHKKCVAFLCVPKIPIFEHTNPEPLSGSTGGLCYNQQKRKHGRRFSTKTCRIFINYHRRIPFHQSSNPSSRNFALSNRHNIAWINLHVCKRQKERAGHRKASEEAQQMNMEMFKYNKELKKR